MKSLLSDIYYLSNSLFKNKRDKMLFNLFRKSTITMYKSMKFKDCFLPQAFYYEVSLKFKYGLEYPLPSLRYVSHFYAREMSHMPSTAYNKFLFHKWLSAIRKNFKILDMASRTNLNLLENPLILNNCYFPISFGLDLNSKNIISKIYLFCTSDYKIKKDLRFRIFNEFIKETNEFNFIDLLKKINDFYFCIELKNNIRKLKVYALYENFHKLLEMVKSCSLDRRIIQQLEPFINRNLPCFMKKPDVCYETLQNKIKIKKIDIQLNRKKCNKLDLLRITDDLFKTFSRKVDISKFVTENFINNIAIYAIGRDFITIYALYKIKE